jgi:hypothetical protein
LVEHAPEHFPKANYVGIHFFYLFDLRLNFLALVVAPVVYFPEGALVGFVVYQILSLFVCAIKFRREVVGRADDCHLLGLIAETVGCACPHIANLEVKRLRREKQHV